MAKLTVLLKPLIHTETTPQTDIDITLLKANDKGKATTQTT